MCIKGYYQWSERQLTEWEKIIANHISGRQYSEYIKNYKKKTIERQPIKKWAKDLNRYFSKDNIQMANQYMKRSSASSLVIKRNSY